METTKRHLIFDLDLTLVNSQVTFFLATNLVRKSLKIKEMTEREFDSLNVFVGDDWYKAILFYDFES